MRIEVKLFAAARQLAGADCVEIELPENARVSDLRQALAERCPEAGGLLRHAMFSMDMDFVSDSEPVRTGAEIACIPPVSGG